MKRTRYILIILITLVVGILTARAVTVSAEEEIRKADEIIETATTYTEAEPETVSLSYSEWQKTQLSTENATNLTENATFYADFDQVEAENTL